MRKRFFINGKPVAGSGLHARYLRPAHVLLDALRQRMQMGNLQQLAQRYVTEDGATITALSRFGQDEIRIDVPVQGRGEVPAPSVPVERRDPQFVEYCVWERDREWTFDPGGFNYYEYILMDRSGTYVYAPFTYPLNPLAPSIDRRIDALTFDAQLRPAGAIHIEPTIGNDIAAFGLQYDAKNDAFALAINDKTNVPDVGTVASDNYLASWGGGSSGYDVHLTGGLLHTGKTWSNGAGLFIGSYSTGARVLDSGSFAELGATPAGDEVEFTSNGDIIGLTFSSGSYTPTYVAFGGSGMDWATGITVSKPISTEERFTFNNAGSRMFYCDSAASVTVLSRNGSAQRFDTSQHGTSHELLHDPVTDAVALCFSNTGALILNATDCLNMPIAPFFVPFSSIPAAFESPGVPTPVRFLQFMAGSLIGYSRAGPRTIVCKVDIGRLRQTKITEPRP